MATEQNTPPKEEAEEMGTIPEIEKLFNRLIKALKAQGLTAEQITAIIEEITA